MRISPGHAAKHRINSKNAAEETENAEHAHNQLALCDMDMSGGLGAVGECSPSLLSREHL